MKLFWILLSLILTFVIIYLIWEEFIVKRERSTTTEVGKGSGPALRGPIVDATVQNSATEAVAQLSTTAGKAADRVAESVAPIADKAAAAVTATTDAAAAATASVVDATNEVAHSVTRAASGAVDTLAEAVADGNEVAHSVTRAASGAVDTLAEAVAGGEVDDLTDIKGIGKVYQQRLNQAGIYSFEQLIETAPEVLKEITEAIEANNVDDWGRQAQLLIDARKHA